MKPTNKLRHVWREVSDGNGTLQVLALQQWWQDDTYWIDENGDKCDNSEWRDVEIDSYA